MKSILIEQVANGWIVRERDECSQAYYRPGSMYVYRNVEELQGDLIRLLSDELPKFDGVNEKAREALTRHEKA